MTESTLKSALVKTAREDLVGYVVLPIQDRFTAGVPDLSINGRSRSSWWEVKYADPEFESSGIQELTMLRLAGTSMAAYYIIYDLMPTKRTLLIHPRYFANWREAPKSPETLWCIGFNHRWVVEQMRQFHESR